MVTSANGMRYGEIAIATVAVGVAPIAIAVIKCALASYFVQEDPWDTAVQCMNNFEVALCTLIPPVALFVAFKTEQYVTHQLFVNRMLKAKT